MRCSTGRVRALQVEFEVIYEESEMNAPSEVRTHDFEIMRRAAYCAVEAIMFSLPMYMLF